MLRNKRVSSTSRSSKATTAVVAELLEDRRLLAAWLSHGVLTVTGTNAADLIRLRDDGTTPGQIVVQLNKKTVGTFDRRLVRSIRVDGGRGNDSIVAGFASGAVKDRRLWVINNSGTGKDSLTVSGNSDSLADTYVTVNRNGSVFSQQASDWTAYDGADPVAWATNRVVRGLFYAIAAVPSSLRAGNIDTLPDAAGTIQASYPVDPMSAGQLIEAENFDSGGQGVSYYDTSAADFGSVYRASEAIDVQRTGDTTDGYYVGWTKPGEWLEYTINVPETGLYDLTERVAIYGTSGKFHVEIDGVDKTGLISVPRTGGWQQWANTTQRGISLEAGQHVLRLAMDAAGSSDYVGNFDWLQLTPAMPYSPSDLSAVPFSSNQISLTWSDNSDNESGFAIERKLGAEGTWELIAMAEANATSYTDGGLYAGEEYTYRVAATNARGNSTATTQAATTIPAVLIPGSGWTGPTPEPAPIGTGAGAEAKAIARWDVVPYQTFTTDFAVGIPAFHINGIDRVEFSVDNGPWVSIREMTLNPQTNVVEYWTMLQASAFTKDGPVEVRAVAYPKVGVPRVLDSLTLHANVHGAMTIPVVFVSLHGSDANPGTEQAPLQTITAALNRIGDGGRVVLLDAGEYYILAGVNRGEVARSNQRWITIEAAPGLAREQVIINQPVRSVIRTFVNRLRWTGVSFDFATILQYYNEPNQWVWFDNVRWFDSNGWAAVYDQHLPNIRLTQTPGGPFETGGSYVTDSLAEDMLYGFTQFSMVRSCDMRRISGDALQNSRFILNTDVTTMRPMVAGWHMDVLQLWGGHENTITYGLRVKDIASTQGIFLQTGSATELNGSPAVANSAFVDIEIQASENGGPPFSQLGGAYEHVLFFNLRLHSQDLKFRTDLADANEFVAKNVVFRDCLFTKRTLSSPITGVLPRGVVFEGCITG